MKTKVQPSDAEVAGLARAYERMRVLRDAVRDARDTIECEHGWDGPICWQVNEKGKYSGEPNDPTGWCSACLQSNRWHVALGTIIRILGGRLRKLQRVAR